jgi:hypothetical protein
MSEEKTRVDIQRGRLNDGRMDPDDIARLEAMGNCGKKIVLLMRAQKIENRSIHVIQITHDEWCPNAAHPESVCTCDADVRMIPVQRIP